MSFVITPLIAGIFDDAPLKDLVPGVGFRAAIYPDGGNSSTFSSGFMYVAYDYAWLNGTLPPFTTSTYALAPVSPGSEIIRDEIWTADTVLYEADLVCNKSSSIEIQPETKESIMKVIVNSDSPYSSTQICEVWSENSDTEAFELLPGGECFFQSSFTRRWASFLRYI